MFVVAARDRVPHGILQQPVLGKPTGGGGMQPTYPTAAPGRQTGTQSIGEEVVVAVPPPLVVERNDEQVPALEGLQHRLTVGTTSQGIAETIGHLLEHTRVKQKLAHPVRLPAQNLLNEIVENKSMAS